MKSACRKIAASLFLLILTLVFTQLAPAAKPQTFTGKVSDAVRRTPHDGR